MAERIAIIEGAEPSTPRI
ncbi:uncharacterized protein G2W53_006925 [Senna tora]|uniref:Uncharacterized protein n=1 Tax=Senna tora TaxID=362788 RepID=A0A834X580_9FABA|nr:uncharacterized protein G2W53_006925 [Senna tora]